MTPILRTQYLSQLEPHVNNHVIKLLKGVRRSGKSTLFGQLKDRLITEGGAQESEFLKLSFGNYKNLVFNNTGKVNAYVQEQERHGIRYLLLDEIQLLPGWELLLESLLEDTKLDIYITNSNAAHIDSDFTRSFWDYYVSFDILPLSYGEISQNLDEEVTFNEYLTYGGFPLLQNVTLDGPSRLKYLEGVCNTVILRDILEQGNFRDPKLITNVLDVYLNNLGEPISGRAIQKKLQKSQLECSLQKTLSYAEALQNAYLLYKCKRFDIKRGSIIQTRAKVYAVDVGIREAFVGNNGEEAERTLENLIFLELKRNGWAIYTGEYGNMHIDFVAIKGKERVYIQVCYLLAERSILSREFGPLEALNDSFPKFVLSLDPIDRSREGITHINIEAFLKNPSLVLGN